MLITLIKFKPELHFGVFIQDNLKTVNAKFDS
jgi:hypothetical protein